MSYHIDFDGIKRDIATLIAWRLSAIDTSALNGKNNINQIMLSFSRSETSQILLSLAARLRIIDDKVKDMNVNSSYKENICGTLWNITLDNDGKEKILGFSKQISFRESLNKILHATIEVDNIRSLGSSGTSIQVQLKGKDWYKTLWQADIDIIQFCDAALGFIGDIKEDYIKAA